MLVRKREVDLGYFDPKEIKKMIDNLCIVW
jgi:hypothetical protein